MSRIVTRLAALAATWALAGAAMAADDIDAGTGWHDPVANVLDVDFGDGSGFHARWSYFHCECGDVLIRFEQGAPEGVTTGEMLLIDGQVLAARGDIAQVDDLETVLQAPLLMLHLSFGLLERAVPEGPSAIGERRHRFSASDNLNAYRLESGRYSGTFDAPWKASGQAWSGAESRRRFEMDFTFTLRDDQGGEDESTITFSGGQDYRPGAFPMQEESSLEGWKVQWISRNETVAHAAESGLTLGALREQTGQTR
ncbi:hypothetical protein F3N42_10640 [Marinihelvus fidelis]|uniref:Uncharacterized protein n=1 Tax=Marinihelvus fidelis TaxID=2613842 RepID=A0A5N0TBV4_9GAMM|nr:hypothetical protein [Marinihelvus fidelis]KAA9130819.1 hypothetical protein F3N42_10640 [Marinihelvus fidelis]